MNKIHISGVEVKIVKKQQNFEWEKFILGFKRPTITALAAVIAHYAAIDNVLAAALAGLIVERTWATIMFYWNR